MSALKLTYFDMDGGRGEPIRLTLAIGNISFEDIRFPISDWPAVKAKMPLGQVPVLELDGEVVTQTNSILRYAGKLAGLYPEEALEALHCDEAMATIESILPHVSATLFIKNEEEKRKAREALAAGPISLHLARLEALLKARGGRYFAGDRFSVADLKVFVWIRRLRSGELEHIPADIVDRLAPGLVAHCDRVSSHPGVAAYYQGRGVK